MQSAPARVLSAAGGAELAVDEAAPRLRPAPGAPIARPRLREATAALPAAERVSLMGVELDCLTEPEVLVRVDAALARGAGGWIMTPNLDILRQMHRDAELRAMATRADLVLADGMPLVWASRVQRTPLPTRVAGSDLSWSVPALAAWREESVFLLGGDPGAAQAAAERLRSLMPELSIAGTLCPERGFERDSDRIAEIVATVAAAEPQVVLVGLGFPKQERLIEHLRPALPKTWFIGVGIALSFLGGNVSRAPRWMQEAGLEWLHRFAQEPERLAKRYLIHGAPFGVRLLASSILARLPA